MMCRHSLTCHLEFKNKKSCLGPVASNRSTTDIPALRCPNFDMLCFCNLTESRLQLSLLLTSDGKGPLVQSSNRKKSLIGDTWYAQSITTWWAAQAELLILFRIDRHPYLSILWIDAQWYCVKKHCHWVSSNSLDSGSQSYWIYQNQYLLILV